MVGKAHPCHPPEISPSPQPLIHTPNCFTRGRLMQAARSEKSKRARPGSRSSSKTRCRLGQISKPVENALESLCTGPCDLKSRSSLRIKIISKPVGALSCRFRSFVCDEALGSKLSSLSVRRKSVVLPTGGCTRPQRRASEGPGGGSPLPYSSNRPASLFSMRLHLQRRFRSVAHALWARL